MNTLLMTKMGIIDTSKKLQRDFAQRYLDHKRHIECGVVYGLYESGNIELANMYSHHLDSIINEQMQIQILHTA